MKFVNLAAIKYRSILTSADGPIARTRVIDNSLSESSHFEVQIWLKPELKSPTVEASELYGNCDATGTDEFLHIATWKAISEALERWAYHHLLLHERSKYGMNIDRTTTGFAALPAWPKSAVKKIAYGEALERWAISNWWQENLTCEIQHSTDAANVAVIKIPESFGYVVITFKKITIDNVSFYSYGFSYGEKFEHAVNKATVEMNRNSLVLANGLKKVVHGISDRRLQYFASDEGFHHFKSKMSRSGPVSGPPDLLVNSEVDGPWSKFTTVWRCLLPNTNYNWEDDTHFMF